MSHLISQLQWLVSMSKTNFHWVIIILGILWGIHIINFALAYRLNYLGLVPRVAPGLIGIATSPFLHGNFTHLLFNSIPLFILLNFMLLGGMAYFIANSLFIIILGGFGVWFIGRKAIHVGASGLIMGYWGFLLYGAILQPSIITIFLVLICLYYFGGFISSLLPDQGSSWEGHVMGFIAGLITRYFQLGDYLMPYFHIN